MIAYLVGEPGGTVVEALLNDPAAFCCAHAVNLIEVFYEVLRAGNESDAQEAMRQLAANGVVFREDFDRVFWENVARLKSRGRISIADCFCIALAQRIGGEVVTADHREFDPLVPLGLCPIRFIR
jgi:PIN domain nuclease of toxin-antitoxin system